jgi:phosphoserine phosphatase
MATTEPVPADAAPATAEETVTAADSALAPAARDVDATSTATATAIGGVDDRRSVPAPSSPSYDDGRGVAFFDLDHTLIDTNSSWLWMKHELNNGKVGAGMLATSVYWFARYAMGFGSGAERAGAEAAELYAGTPEEKLRREVDAFFEKELAHRARPGGKPIMEKHIRAGERCVVCTSSWQHPAASAARLFNCESGASSSFASIDHHRAGPRAATPALVPIRRRSRGERRSLRTFPGASLRPPPLALDPDAPRRLATPSSDAPGSELRPDAPSLSRQPSTTSSPA